MPIWCLHTSVSPDLLRRWPSSLGTLDEYLIAQARVSLGPTPSRVIRIFVREPGAYQGIRLLVYGDTVTEAASCAS